MRYLLTLCLAVSFLTGQSQTKTYFSGSGEMIFSFAKMTVGGSEKSSNLRWSPVFNGQGLMNHDMTQHFGIFYGLAYRNVGFIYEKSKDTLMKHRTYNIGIPIGVKLGNLDGTFLFGGYEFEMPFSYKEKMFVDEKKVDKFDVWFSNRVNWYTQAVFVGVNFKGGTSIKFKYYLDNFFNKSFTEPSGPNPLPYANMNVNVFYFSLSWNAFKDVKGYSKSYKSSSSPSAL